MIQPLQLSTWFLCRKGCSECSLLVSEEDEIAKSKEGKKYFGWDEPSKIDFQTL